MTALNAIKDFQGRFADMSSAEAVAAVMEGEYRDASARDVIAGALRQFGDRFALVSSFGAESAVLLHLAASVSKDIPILFLDTGKLFGETKRFRDDLVTELGLRDVLIQKPAEEDVKSLDPKGALWRENNNACCFIRKVKPLSAVLDGFDAWGTGRKRFQGGLREELPHFEASDDRVKVNPLAFWTKQDVTDYMEKYNLPRHPLVAEGFSSIGCMPCTERVSEGEDERAGRWRGKSKSECGIHMTLKENALLASYESSGL